jgi:hypothetical protein
MTPVLAECQTGTGVRFTLTINDTLSPNDGPVHDLGRPHKSGTIVEGQQALPVSVTGVNVYAYRWHWNDELGFGEVMADLQVPVRTMGARTSFFR